MRLLQSLPEPLACPPQTGDAYSVEHLIEAADSGAIVYIIGCCPTIAVEWWQELVNKERMKYLCCLFVRLLQCAEV